MYDLLKYYYDITADYIEKNGNKYYFNHYILQLIERPLNLEALVYTQQIPSFHTLIINKYRNYFSNYGGKNYILMKVNCLENRFINNSDVIFISSYCANFKYENVRNYSLMWLKKAEYLERKHALTGCTLDSDFYFAYGLAITSINYCKNVDYKKIRYGLIHTMINCVQKANDFYNPINVSMGPIVNNFADYVKYKFFDKNETIDIDEFPFINIHEAILFLGRLIFPSYYFDLYKREFDVSTKNRIVNNISNYLVYINSLILCIKKRQYNVPSINWFVNQFL